MEARGGEERRGAGGEGSLGKILVQDMIGEGGSGNR